MITRQDVTRPPVLDPSEVRCHYCGARPGEPCTPPAPVAAELGPHAHRARAASAAHDGWEAGQVTTPPLGWWGLGTPTQGVLRHVYACVQAGTAGSYRPDTRSNPIYEWAAIRNGYYTWTPDTGAELTPHGRALLTQGGYDLTDLP